jgi:hypothetical protein
MSNTCQLIAAADFGPTTGGFAFRAPTVPLLGPVRRYLAIEIQKAEIIAMLITRRPILKPVMLAVVLMMWVAALASLVWLYGAGRENPTPTDLVVMIILTVAPVITRLQRSLRRAARRLRRK